MSQAPPLAAADRTVPPRAVRLATAAAAVVAVAVHVWALYRDHAPPTPRWFPQADKLEHLVGFGLPCFLVLLAVGSFAGERGSRGSAAGRLRTRWVALVVGLFVVHAGVSEIVQGDFYTTRSGDPFDALADLVGTALGLLAYLAVRRRAGASPSGGTRRGRA